MPTHEFTTEDGRELDHMTRRPLPKGWEYYDVDARQISVKGSGGFAAIEGTGQPGVFRVVARGGNHATDEIAGTAAAVEQFYGHVAHLASVPQLSKQEAELFARSQCADARQLRAGERLPDNTRVVACEHGWIRVGRTHDGVFEVARGMGEVPVRSNPCACGAAPRRANGRPPESSFAYLIRSPTRGGWQGGWIPVLDGSEWAGMTYEGAYALVKKQAPTQPVRMFDEATGAWMEETPTGWAPLAEGATCGGMIDLARPKSGEWEGRGFGRRYVFRYDCPACGREVRMRATSWRGGKPAPSTGAVRCAPTRSNPVTDAQGRVFASARDMQDAMVARDHAERDFRTPCATCGRTGMTSHYEPYPRGPHYCSAACMATGEGGGAVEGPAGLRVNGVYDPGILKAVFLAGGPGSGKSYAASELFGFGRGHGIHVSSPLGLKLVNSDPAFEMFLRRQGVDPADLATLPPERFLELTEGPDSPRTQAKRVRDAQFRAWTDGRLGVVLDGTGDDYPKIARQREQLRALGYDTFMVFVNTTLDVAQQRNAMRARKLPEHLVESIWRDVQQNLGKFQSLFGASNMAIVDNTTAGARARDIQKAVNAFIRQPIQNHIGREWIRAELAKRSGAVVPAAANRGAAPVRRNHHLPPGTAVAHATHGQGTVSQMLPGDWYLVTFARGDTRVPGAELTRQNPARAWRL